MPRAPNEDERLALLGRQLGQGVTQFIVFHLRNLRRLCHHRLGVIVYGLQASPPSSPFRIEVIAQDSDEPCGHMRAGLERVDACAGAQQGFLNEILGLIAVPAQRNCESSQLRYGRQHGVTNFWRKSHMSNSWLETFAICRKTRVPAALVPFESVRGRGSSSPALIGLVRKRRSSVLVGIIVKLRNSIASMRGCATNECHAEPA